MAASFGFESRAVVTSTSCLESTHKNSRWACQHWFPCPGIAFDGDFRSNKPGQQPKKLPITIRWSSDSVYFTEVSLVVSVPGCDVSGVRSSASGVYYGSHPLTQPKKLKALNIF